MEPRRAGQTRRALDFTVSREHKMKKDSDKDYSGIHFTNSLRVDRPIQLTGFTFFAPVKLGDTEYEVVVKTMRKPVMVDRFRVFKSKAELEAVTNQRIRINPPRQIPIEPNVWYDVKFQIDGPKTPHMEYVYGMVSVYPTGDGTNAAKDQPLQDIATFDFLVGSGQLPEYHFVLS